MIVFSCFSSFFCFFVLFFSLSFLFSFFVFFSPKKTENFIEKSQLLLLLLLLFSCKIFFLRREWAGDWPYDVDEVLFGQLFSRLCGKFKTNSDVIHKTMVIAADLHEIRKAKEKIVEMESKFLSALASSDSVETIDLFSISPERCQVFF